MLTQRVMAERLRLHRIQCIDGSHDLANAFGSTPEEDLLEAVDVSGTPDDVVFFKQRMVNSVAQLSFNDEPDFVYMKGVGTFMGTPEGPRFF